MKSRPLADEFGPWTAVFKFISGDTSILVTGHVADAVTAGLDGVHLYAGQLRQNVG